MSLEKAIADCTAALNALTVSAAKLDETLQRISVSAPAAAVKPAATPAPVKPAAAAAPDYVATSKAVTELVNKVSRQAALDVLAKFEATKLPEVPPEKYAEVIKACEVAMSQPALA